MFFNILPGFYHLTFAKNFLVLFDFAVSLSRAIDNMIFYDQTQGRWLLTITAYWKTSFESLGITLLILRCRTLIYQSFFLLFCRPFSARETSGCIPQGVPFEIYCTLSITFRYNFIRVSWIFCVRYEGERSLGVSHGSNNLCFLITSSKLKFVSLALRSDQILKFRSLHLQLLIAVLQNIFNSTSIGYSCTIE